MTVPELKAALEAVLFAHAEPLAVNKIAEILEIEPATVEKLVLQLRDECEAPERGIQLIQLENGWQFATKNEYGEAVKVAMDNRRNTPLQPASLEVLAIIAYNQPVSRSFIEQVRGVDSSSTVAGLVQKGLIEETGRLDLPGRPIAFCTTDAFLRTFGIRSLSQLPPLHSEEPPADTDDAALYQMQQAGRAAKADELPDAADANTEETQVRGGGEYVEDEGGAAVRVPGEAQP